MANDDLQAALKRISELEKKVEELSKPSVLKCVMIMYNSDADREIFSTLRNIQHYIKWENVKGTGSGGMSVIGPVEENQYCIVMLILPAAMAEGLYNDICALRGNMVRTTGIASLIFPIDKIG